MSTLSLCCITRPKSRYGRRTVWYIVILAFIPQGSGQADVPFQAHLCLLENPLVEPIFYLLLYYRVVRSNDAVE